MGNHPDFSHHFCDSLLLVEAYGRAEKAEVHVEGEPFFMVDMGDGWTVPSSSCFLFSDGRGCEMVGDDEEDVLRPELLIERD